MSTQREELVRKRNGLMVNIGKLRREVEMVEYAIQAIDGELPKWGDEPLEVTAGGTVKGMQEAISKLVKAHGPLFTSDIAQALFTHSMPMTYAVFYRRTSVHVCDMATKRGTLIPTGRRNKKRENEWAHPSLLNT